jgi:hypothetical protein
MLPTQHSLVEKAASDTNYMDNTTHPWLVKQNLLLAMVLSEELLVMVLAEHQPQGAVTAAAEAALQRQETVALAVLARSLAAAAAAARQHELVEHLAQAEQAAMAA